MAQVSNKSSFLLWLLSFSLRPLCQRSHSKLNMLLVNGCLSENICCCWITAPLPHVAMRVLHAGFIVLMLCVCWLTQMLFYLVLFLALTCNGSDPSGVQRCNTNPVLWNTSRMVHLTFAVDFSVFLGLSGRLQALATLCTSEAVLMPRLWGERHF